MDWIYCIYNKVNKKKYVGKTWQLQHRKDTHFSNLRCNRHPNMELQKDFNKYGEENFEFLILEFITPSDKFPCRDARSAEKDWMLALETNNPEKGYNSKDRYFYYCDRKTGKSLPLKKPFEISPVGRIPLDCLILEGGE